MIQSLQPISFKVTATWIHKQGLEKQEHLLSITCRTCLVLGWLNSFNGEGKSCIDITDTSMQPPISAPFVSDRHTRSLLSRANLHEEYLLNGKIAREIADTPICDSILVSESNYFNIQLMRKLSATTVVFKCSNADLTVASFLQVHSLFLRNIYTKGGI